MHIHIDALGMTDLQGTVTTNAICNNSLPHVPLTANGNVPTPCATSGFIQAQSSDCMARFDGDGNPMNPPPEKSLLAAQVSNGFTAPNTNGGFVMPNDTYIYGYTCPGCGIWVGNGTYHTCGVNPIQQITTFPKIEMKPHLCPVCEGKGQVAFNPADPLATSRDRNSWPCKPCTGTGVLWQ